MKLNELKKGDKVYGTISDGSNHAIIHRIFQDYATCKSEKGNIVNLGSIVELEQFVDGYKVL